MQDNFTIPTLTHLWTIISHGPLLSNVASRTLQYERSNQKVFGILEVSGCFMKCYYNSKFQSLITDLMIGTLAKHKILTAGSSYCLCLNSYTSGDLRETNNEESMASYLFAGCSFFSWVSCLSLVTLNRKQ